MSEINLKMIIDGIEYTTNSTPSFDRKNKWVQPDTRVVTSIIPGTIVEVFVQEGQKVVEGGNMLVVEAMKMNNQIKFARDGIIDKILVKPGDIVTKGQRLMILR